MECRSLRTLVAGLACLSLVGLLPGSAQALSVFRCTASDGAITFQDRPCPRGAQSRIIELPDQPDQPDQPDRAAASAAPAVTREAASTASPSQRERAPAPSDPPAAPAAVVCTREDGSRYLSESGRGDRQAVPLAMLGVPSQSLAGAYAGRDGIGISSPGLRQPPTDASPGAQLGALYVWREDPCERLSGAPLCAYFDSRVADAERRLRLAFSDTAEAVRHELDGLRERAATCRH